MNDPETDLAKIFPVSKERLSVLSAVVAIREEAQKMKIIDKRGHVPAEHTPEPKVHPSTALPVGGGDRAQGKATAAPPSAEQLRAVLEQIDFLHRGDKFWCRDVEYEVIDELPTRNAVVISPVQLGRETRKRMKKAGRPR